MIYRRSMTEHVSGDDARLPQRRHLVTEIPGPVSRELLTRRERAVARGLSHVLPVFVTDAGGGVIVDADGVGDEHRQDVAEATGHGALAPGQELTRDRSRDLGNEVSALGNAGVVARNVLGHDLTISHESSPLKRR